MKICLISKYPPIEGGVSSSNYWITKSLGERGHKVFVVTNAWEVEDEYREIFRGEDLEKYQPKNVTLFNTDPCDIRGHIPYSKNYVEKLSNLAIEVIEKYDVDVINSRYMIPYVIAGYLASNLTGKPQILRHAGSDITRLFHSPYMNTLFKKIFKNVDKICTIKEMEEDFISMGVPSEKIAYETGRYTNIEEFNPKKVGNLKEYGIDDNFPIITFIGKANKYKGIFYLLDACSEIKDNFTLLLVIGKYGREYNEVYQRVKFLGIEKKVKILDFLPPWRIPKIMASSTVVVCPEHDFPVKIHLSTIPIEAMACGTCPIISRELFEKHSYMDLKDGTDVIVIDPTNKKQFSNKLAEIIKNPQKADEIGKNSRKKIEENDNFGSQISEMLEVYESVLK